jgi:hypothetical protein
VKRLDQNGIIFYITTNYTNFSKIETPEFWAKVGYQKKSPELIHREFIDGVQGRVQLRGNRIEISIYGFEHEAAAAALLANLDAKLKKAGVEPRIPWLGNRRLRFKFH